MQHIAGSAVLLVVGGKHGPTPRLGLTAEEVGLTLAEGKKLLGELARLMLQTQMEEFVTCARVCRDCMKLRRLRDGRTRKVQTLFVTLTIDAPRISGCSCMNVWGFVDISQAPLADLLPEPCTPELQRLQAALSARHSCREAARLLTALLPGDPVSHATMRNRTDRVAADLERMVAAQPIGEPQAGPAAEIMVLTDGAHILAAHGYQSRHLDVSVGKIEVAGKPPRRFALAPMWAEAPLAHCVKPFESRDGCLAAPSRCSATAKRRFLVLCALRSASL